MQNLSWQAPSFHFIEKSSAWYMWSIIVSVVLAGLALIQGNILFLFFVVIAEALLLTLGKQKPRLLLYSATAEKISVDNYREYPYTEMSGFSIVVDPRNERYHELVLTPAKRLAVHIKILFPTERTADLRNLLAARLPEIAYEESFSDSLIKRIGL